MRRVVQLDDPAHLVLPFLAQRASQHIEDAAVLATYLAAGPHTTGASQPALVSASGTCRRAPAARAHRPASRPPGYPAATAAARSGCCHFGHTCGRPPAPPACCVGRTARRR